MTTNNSNEIANHNYPYLQAGHNYEVKQKQKQLAEAYKNIKPWIFKKNLQRTHVSIHNADEHNIKKRTNLHFLQTIN